MLSFLIFWKAMTTILYFWTSATKYFTNSLNKLYLLDKIVLPSELGLSNSYNQK